MIPGEYDLFNNPRPAIEKSSKEINNEALKELIAKQNKLRKKFTLERVLPFLTGYDYTFNNTFSYVFANEYKIYNYESLAYMDDTYDDDTSSDYTILGADYYCTIHFFKDNNDDNLNYFHKLLAEKLGRFCTMNIEFRHLELTYTQDVLHFYDRKRKIQNILNQND